MTTEQIEQRLHNSPKITAPKGLRERLIADIDLSAQIQASSPRKAPQGSWIRRWIPAVGFALWFIGCIIALGVQASRIHELREQERAVAQAAATAEQAGANGKSAANAGQQAERNSPARIELAALRAEVAQLRAELAELPQLQAQNAQLRAELKSRPVAQAKPDEDFFTVQKERASRTQCINSMKQLCLAGRLWANDSKLDAMPASFDALKSYLPASKRDAFLCCPKDGTTPYAMVSPGASENRPEVVFIHCVLHNNAGLVDGSVYALRPEQKLVEQNGTWVIGK